jgi:hypothetical protein
MTVTINEKAVKRESEAAENRKIENFDPHHRENPHFVKEIHEENSSEKTNQPNYLSFKPKKGSAAETEITKVPSTKKKLDSIGAFWRGGSFNKSSRDWNHPEQAFRAIELEKKVDLLETLEELKIEKNDIEFTPVYLPPPPSKHRKDAGKTAKEVSEIRGMAHALQKEMDKEINDLEISHGKNEIPNEVLDQRIKETQEKYQPKIDELKIRADKKEESELKILKEGAAKGDSEDSFLIEPGKTHAAAKEGRKILSDPIHAVFQRSGRTVWLSNCNNYISRNNAIKKPDGAIQISEVDEPFLIEKLSEIHSWAKYDARAKENKPVDFPSMAARMILSRNGEGLQYLKGFINAPTIRFDGSLLTKPGYDKETGLFFDPLGTEFQKIPDYPTKDDAVLALSILVDLIDKFPFEDDVSKSVAISELMTGVIRRSLRLAPIYANDAPAASSGKSLIAKLPCYIATGKEPTLVSPSKNEEEMRKRLAACLMDGDLVICIDNVDFPLESRDLCIVSTSETWRERILGVSKNAQIETNAQIIITGNNLSIVGDLCTRTLKCRLVPKVEHPEERCFNVDLNLYVPKNRGSIAMAVLTIIRAYIVAGEPTQSKKGFREYMDWCRFVRDPLLWLGCADPCESIRRMQDLDPKRSKMESIFGAIKAFPADSFTSKQLIEAASNRVKREENEIYQHLYDALVNVAGKKDGDLCSTKLGNELKELKDKICNGMQLKEAGKDRTNKTLWKLVSA